MADRYLEEMSARIRLRDAEFRALPCGGSQEGLSRCSSDVERSCRHRAHVDCPREARREEYINAARTTGALRDHAERSGIPEYALRKVLDEVPDATDAIRMLCAAIVQHGSTITVLAGGVGVGKTIAAARWAIAARARFATAESLSRASVYDKEHAQNERCSMVIDDLGAEYADKGGLWLARLDGVINQHVADCLPLVITTNLAQAAFRERYGERVWDRIRGHGRFMTIGGPSLRRPRLEVVR